MNIVHDPFDAGPPDALPERLARVDLNLLVAFDALAREQSVTRAARRLGLTQSALSHALGRLRVLLDDPLLVRGRRGMTLTPRAEALAGRVRSGLVTLGHALAEPAVFEPATARRAFTIASPDLFDVVAVPALLARVRAEAPGVDLALTPLREAALPALLETGEVDVAVLPRLVGDDAAPPPSGLVQRVLFRDRFVCFLRPAPTTPERQRPTAPERQRPTTPERQRPTAAPAKQRRPLQAPPAKPASGGQPRASALTLERYAALSHVVVSGNDTRPSLVDRALAERGLRRRVALRLPHFYSALAITAASDLVLTAPTALARFIPAGSGLVVLEPPLPLPEHTVQLVWHERFTSDPGHRWLRRTLSEVARAARRDPTVDGAGSDPR